MLAKQAQCINISDYLGQEQLNNEIVVEAEEDRWRGGGHFESVYFWERSKFEGGMKTRGIIGGVCGGWGGVNIGVKVLITNRIIRNSKKNQNKRGGNIE